MIRIVLVLNKSKVPFQDLPGGIDKKDEKWWLKLPGGRFIIISNIQKLKLKKEWSWRSPYKIQILVVS
jgi:hypothetical protein